MIRSRDGVLQLGPEDSGAELAHDDFVNAEYATGYRYELVVGRLRVTPSPNPPHAVAQTWFTRRLFAYAEAHPDVVGYISPFSRLLTRALGAMTDVQPDLCAYRSFPLRAERWEGLLPFLVVEVISPTRPRKDTVRNREIYEKVPELLEYWIVNPKARPDPSMLALVRRPDGAWVERPVAAGGTYRTDLLPGLALDLSTVFQAS